MINDKHNDFAVAVASAAANLSTCAKLHVGAVLMRDGSILATGYNGAPRGRPHCNERDPLASHHEWSELNEIHAEMNCIACAVRNGTNITGAWLYITHAPCLMCAKLIVAVGITRVIYTNWHPKGEAGVTFLANNNVRINNNN